MIHIWKRRLPDFVYCSCTRRSILISNYSGKYYSRWYICTFWMCWLAKKCNVYRYNVCPLFVNLGHWWWCGWSQRLIEHNMYFCNFSLMQIDVDLFVFIHEKKKLYFVTLSTIRIERFYFQFHTKIYDWNFNYPWINKQMHWSNLKEYKMKIMRMIEVLLEKCYAPVFINVCVWIE